MSSNVRTEPLVDREELNKRLVHLLAKCQSGDESAFEEIYKLCSAQLYGVLIRILKIEAVAEEALQETFVNIWQNADTFKSASGSPMAWLYSIARHRALDILRRRYSRENLETADVSGFVESTPDSTKSIQEMSEDAAQLIMCLERLPEGPRICITRVYCEGYSYQELVDYFNKPSGTIKSWLRRGLISLKECLDEYS